MDGDNKPHNQLAEKVRGYRMPQAAQELLAAHPPLIIAGISASGKNSTTKEIVQTSGYRPVITHTTRQPRAGEINGQDYFFVSDQRMLDLLDAAAMVEVNLVHEDVYGVSIKAYHEVLNLGYKPLLAVDIQGVEDISRYVPNLRPVFLVPPNFDTWMHWLSKRGRMSHAEKQRRMRSARSELKKALQSKILLPVVNQDISQTVRQILGEAHDISSKRHGREAAQLLLDHLDTI